MAALRQTPDLTFDMVKTPPLAPVHYPQGQNHSCDFPSCPSPHPGEAKRGEQHTERQRLRVQRGAACLVEGLCVQTGGCMFKLGGCVLRAGGLRAQSPGGLLHPARSKFAHPAPSSPPKPNCTQQTV